MSGAKALLGNELTTTNVKDQPSVSWNADPNSFYTLCLTGKYSIILTNRLQVFKFNIIVFIVIPTTHSEPDAPSRAEPTQREWHHWLVGNIPGGNVSLGETLSGYIGSGPLPNIGRY